MTDNKPTHFDILTTCALPYANGSLHFGHLLGYVNADIWVRAQREQGKHVAFVCADDTHGTPILLGADKAGVDPETYIKAIGIEHQNDFNNFNVIFDHYGSTHSAENKTLVGEFFQGAKSKGYIVEKPVVQFFDPARNLFLPDRYVTGTCPKCQKKDQYGDNCEGCGATYDATDLIDPVSALSGATPSVRESTHVFLSTERGRKAIEGFLASGAVSTPVGAKISEWTKELRDWDISRDQPYFGFPVPGYDHLAFYVWFDAPIGYISSFSEYCASQNINWRECLSKNSDIKIHHFIGKDIINFHSVFWPVLLESNELKAPSRLHVNGYVTGGGDKFSKSKGKPILAKDYIDNGFSADFLRYYYASRQSGALDDLEFSPEDFVTKTNADLVGKFANLASRTAKILSTHFDNKLSKPDEKFLSDITNNFFEHAKLFETGDTARIIREFVEVCDKTNQFFDAQKPWVLLKNEDTKYLAQDACTQAIYHLRVLGAYLKPICPETVNNLETFLGAGCSFDDIKEGRALESVNDYAPLATRILLLELDKIVPKLEQPEKVLEPKKTVKNLG